MVLRLCLARISISDGRIHTLISSHMQIQRYWKHPLTAFSHSFSPNTQCSHTRRYYCSEQAKAENGALAASFVSKMTHLCFDTILDSCVCARFDNIALAKHHVNIRSLWRHLRVYQNANGAPAQQNSIPPIFCPTNSHSSTVYHMVRFTYTCNNTRVVTHIAPGRHYRMDFNNKNRFSKQHFSYDA